MELKDLLPNVINRLEKYELEVYEISKPFEDNDFVSGIIDEMEEDILDLKDVLVDLEQDDQEDIGRYIDVADDLIDNLNYTIKTLKMTIEEEIEPQSLSQWKKDLIQNNLYSTMVQYAFNYMHGLLEKPMDKDDDTIIEPEIQRKVTTLPADERFQLQEINSPLINSPNLPGLKQHFKPEVAEASLIQDLIKIADSLDKSGLHNEADLVDSLIQKISK